MVAFGNVVNATLFLDTPVHLPSPAHFSWPVDLPQHHSPPRPLQGDSTPGAHPDASGDRPLHGIGPSRSPRGKPIPSRGRLTSNSSRTHQRRARTTGSTPYGPPSARVAATSLHVGLQATPAQHRRLYPPPAACRGPGPSGPGHPILSTPPLTVGAPDSTSWIPHGGSSGFQLGLAQLITSLSVLYDLCVAGYPLST
jgi:hypothetical protein